MQTRHKSTVSISPDFFMWGCLSHFGRCTQSAHAALVKRQPCSQRRDSCNQPSEVSLSFAHPTASQHQPAIRRSRPPPNVRGRSPDVTCPDRSRLDLRSTLLRFRTGTIKYRSPTLSCQHSLWLLVWMNHDLLPARGLELKDNRPGAISA